MNQLALKITCYSFSFLILISCGGGGAGEIPFNAELFRLHRGKLIEDESISDSDMNNAVYFIRRHDDLGYENLDGMKYAEIIAKGNQLSKEGWGVELARDEDGEIPSFIQAGIETTGVGLARKGTSSTLTKSVLSVLEIENTSDKRVAINAVHADVMGPFGDWITTVTYVLNCPIEPKNTLKSELILNGKLIDYQLKAGSEYAYLYTALDTVMNNLTWIPRHIEMDPKAQFYSECKQLNARIEPAEFVNVHEEEWADYASMITDANGKRILNLKSPILKYERAEKIQYR